MTVREDYLGVRRLELEVEDIAEIRGRVRNLFGMSYFYHEIELRHKPEAEVDKAYLVITPEFKFNGYLKNDGLTIVQY